MAGGQITHEPRGLKSSSSSFLPSRPSAGLILGGSFYLPLGRPGKSKKGPPRASARRESSSPWPLSSTGRGGLESPGLTPVTARRGLTPQPPGSERACGREEEVLGEGAKLSGPPLLTVSQAQAALSQAPSTSQSDRRGTRLPRDPRLPATLHTQPRAHLSTLRGVQRPPDVGQGCSGRGW